MLTAGMRMWKRISSNERLKFLTKEEGYEDFKPSKKMLIWAAENGDNNKVQKHSIEQLKYFHTCKEAQQTLLRIATTPEKYYREVRIKAVEALEFFKGNIVLDGLLEVICEDKKPSVRSAAWDVLKWFKDDAVFVMACDRIVAGYLSMTLVSVLEKFSKYNKAYEPLVYIATNAGRSDQFSPRARKKAISILKNLNDKRTQDILVSIAQDEEDKPSVRITAMKALRSMKTKKASETLVELAMNGRDPQIRTQAVYSLESFYSNEINSTLSYLLENEKFLKVRKAARRILRSRQS